MNINGLEIKKVKNDYIVSDDDRSFKIYSNGEVEETWFCSYPTLLSIIDYIDEMKLFKEEE